MAVGIASLTLMAVLGMINFQQIEGKAINQQLARASLKYNILQTLKNPQNCLCQFNDLASPPHTIDTTKTAQGTPGYEIDLGIFRSGCSDSSDDNILAKENEIIRGSAGISALTVKVSGILDTETSNEFLGDLTIPFKEEGLVRIMKNLTVPICINSSNNACSAEGSCSRLGRRKLVSCLKSLKVVTRFNVLR